MRLRLNKGYWMSSYGKKLLITMVSVVAYATLFSTDVLHPECGDIRYKSMRTLVNDYILAHCAVFSTIPIVSAVAIKSLTGAPLKDCKGAFYQINGELAKKVIKTMPFTAAMMYSYNTYQQNMYS
jgi:hypothetical protein